MTPQELLENLSQHFPPEYKETFMKNCEEMKRIRTEAQNALSESQQSQQE